MGLVVEGYKRLIYDEVPEFLKPFLELKEIKRLKKISYFCGMDYGPSDVYNFLDYYFRYDHSLNCAMLYYKLTNDRKGTVACLFHDISTPVFSHVVDIMAGDNIKQEYTESFNSYYISKIDGIHDLLYECGMKFSDISDLKKYPVGDNDRPRLCVDRLDAVMVNNLLWSKASSLPITKMFLDNLCIVKNEDGCDEIGFKDENIAKIFFKFSLIDAGKSSEMSDIFSMNLMADILKKGIEFNIFTKEDLFKFDEEEFVYILSNSLLGDFYNDFKNMNKSDIYYSLNYNDDFYNYSLKTKKRYVDPLVIVGGSVNRLTNVCDECKSLKDDFVNKKTVGYVTNKRIRKID